MMISSSCPLHRPGLVLSGTSPASPGRVPIPRARSRTGNCSPSCVAEKISPPLLIDAGRRPVCDQRHMLPLVKRKCRAVLIQWHVLPVATRDQGVEFPAVPPDPELADAVSRAPVAGDRADLLLTIGESPGRHGQLAVLGLGIVGRDRIVADFRSAQPQALAQAAFDERIAGAVPVQFPVGGMSHFVVKRSIGVFPLHPEPDGGFQLPDEIAIGSRLLVAAVVVELQIASEPRSFDSTRLAGLPGST